MSTYADYQAQLNNALNSAISIHAILQSLIGAPAPSTQALLDSVVTDITAVAADLVVTQTALTLTKTVAPNG